jgi:hypothetical protein
VKQALPVRLRGHAAEHPVGAGVPYHHGAAAVIALRDNALESGLIEGMVLYFDGEMALAFLRRNSLWHRP